MARTFKDSFTREELAEFYQNHSYLETLEHFQISGGILDRRLKAYGIQRQSSHDKNIKIVTREDLYQYYIVENHDKAETREHFGLTDWALSQFFREFNIRKNKSEVVNLREKTKEQRYGDPRYNNRTKYKDTCNQRYGGVGFGSEELKQKSNKTTAERYGAENIRKTDFFKQRAAQTKLERYGDPGYNNLEQMRQTCLERYGTVHYVNLIPKKDSAPERRIRELLGGSKVRIQGREFDIQVNNTLVEVDGDFWHPITVSNLRAVHIRNLVNDYIKEDIAKEVGLELIRVRVGDLAGLLDEEITLDKLRELNYRPTYQLDFNRDILSPGECERCVQEYGKETFERYLLDDMVKLIQICQPDFPEIPKTEDLQTIIKKLRTLDVESYYKNTGSFTFNCGSVGSNIIKSRFRSFWQASNKGRKSPVEAWQDQDIMRDIIKYRVGLGSREEYHGLGLKQIIQGMNVNRYLVSFFKPELAAAIYKHYLGDKEKPVVFDPSMGFGARLLAFKSLYPDGTYIGCEPNLETFKELQALVQEAGFTNVTLYNCKLEDLEQIPEYDLGFTSPPYFNIEDYRNGVEYQDFSDWQEKFWNKLVSLPNMYININEQLLEQLADPSLKVIDTIVKGKNPITPTGKSREVIIKRQAG